ncbi:MAG TPA: efflux RND transporter permease subunit [Bacteroidia bacterium]|nr:efflux RND transporter permease subunit [Bacteroidia bacterium]
MVHFAFRNKHLIIVIALLVAILGIVSVSRLPVDILPVFKSPAIEILTVYQGMPPDMVEKDISTRLERFTSQADGIQTQESKSITGVSVVKDYFHSNVSPDAAIASVSSLVNSDMSHLPPGTLPPIVLPFDPTASIPLALLTVSSDSLNEQQLYDIAQYTIRTILQTVDGITAPAVYGGKLRQILIYVDPEKLQNYNLSQTDVMRELEKNNVMIPTGDINIGAINYNVAANAMFTSVDEFNDIVLKKDDKGNPVYLKDIGYAKDGNQIQTNIARVNGKNQVYIPLYRRNGSNIINDVNGVREKIPTIEGQIPSSIKLNTIFDQSVYVKHSVSGLLKEGLTGIGLLCLVLLFFLGNYRSALIVAISIPLALMVVFLGLSFTDNTINSMTLGGMALSVGLLVDTAIVVLENIDKHLHEGQYPEQAAIIGTKEVTMPVIITALTIVIVFFPIVFLTGVARFLFPALAIAVSFAMGGSLFFSLTLVPIMSAAMLKNPIKGVGHKGILGRFQNFLNRLLHGYEWLLDKALKYAKWVITGVVVLFIAAMFLIKGIGTEFFPQMDVGQFTVFVHLDPGTRIEVTQQKIGEIENEIKAETGNELTAIVSNIGVQPNIDAAYTPNSGTQDAFINVQLKDEHRTPTKDFVEHLRQKLNNGFPGVSFAFNMSGIVGAALNNGAPSPIDIQITGSRFSKLNEIAVKIRDIAQQVPGARDVRIDERISHPEIDLHIDRTKAAMVGLSTDEIIKNVESSLNSSSAFNSHLFWVDPRTGNDYFLGVTYPQYRLDDASALGNVSISNDNSDKKDILLKDVATISTGSQPIEIKHIDVQRTMDVYANVQGRDIGSVATEIEKAIKPVKDSVPLGYTISAKGEIKSMNDAFGSLGFGLILAILMVYLIIVPLLRSFKLPLIIIMVVPLGLIGVVFMLFFSHTYFNIQSFMGIIMMVGITVSYSTLLVDKMNANMLKEETKPSVMDEIIKEGKMPLKEAVRRGASNRFRPILMSATVAIFSLAPMAFGNEIGGEANVPLARAIIGGVFAALVLSLFVVPVIFYLFNKKKHELPPLQITENASPSNS